MTSFPSPAMRAALAGLFAMAAAMGVGRFVYTPVLPHMIAEGALTPSEAGLVAGSNFLGYLLGALAASNSVFAPRRRTWLFLALATSVATTALMALAGSLPVMLALRFLSGVASAFSMIFITALVLAKLAEDRRPGLIALHFGGVGIGIAGSAALVSVLSAYHTSWPQLWVAAGLAALFCWLAMRFLLPETTAETRRDPKNASSGGSVTPALALFIAGYGFFGFGYVITATFINAMARAEPVLAPVEPWVWMIVGISGVPSVWLWNRLAARTSITFAYLVACLVEAVGVCLSVVVVSPYALAISAILLGGTFMAVTALGLARARAMAPQNAAAVIAFMTAAFGLGQMIGPVLAGYLFDHTGNLVAASLCATVALLAAAALTMLAQRVKGAEKATG
ncbi:MAG: YbfB/YjiJ family MFS transporter [Nitratireductor sp.]